MPEKKYIISVGAGLTQKAFLEYLAGRGYGIIAFGRGRNCQSAIDLCDYFEEIDTHDHALAIKWLKSLPVKFDGAGSFAGGGAILTLQKILSEFNLPTKIPSQLHIGMDKTAQQQFYKHHRLSGIQTWRVSDFALSETDAEHFIIKPAVGRGSEGVRRVNRKKINYLIDHKLDQEDVIQTYIDGIEYRVIVIVQNYRLKLMAPVKRASFRNTFLLGRLSYCDEHIKKLDGYFSTLIKKLNLKDVILKTDVIVAPGSIEMIEMDIGVGGGLYYKEYISKLMSYDLTGNYIKLINGDKTETAVCSNPGLFMDYVYNTTGAPVQYSLTRLNQVLDSLFEDYTFVENFLKPHEHGKCSSNAHFIFNVIHENKNVTNNELNEVMNKHVFEKISEKDMPEKQIISA